MIEFSDSNHKNEDFSDLTETHSEEEPSESILSPVHEEKIKQLEKDLKDQREKNLYLLAEFENFKKRSIKERSESIKFGCEAFAKDMISVLDTLEIAFSHIAGSTDKSLIDGLKLVIQQFKTHLQKQGVEPIETLEKIFDPHLHEAMGQAPSSLPAGTIAQEYSRGYTLHGRLLRPARVAISKGSEVEANS